MNETGGWFGPLRAFLENPIVLSAFSSWFLAQFIKAAIILLTVSRRGKKERLAALIWRTGGMPSSHAAIVSSMTVSIGFVEGPASNLLALSFFVAAVVIRDALGVRHSAGIQARSLNNLGRETAEKLGVDFHPVKEVQGHRPIEVVAGCLLGGFVAGAVCAL